MPLNPKRPTRKRRMRLRVESLEARRLLHGDGSLSGSVYLDADGDGTRDATEIGIPGVVVRLSDSDASDDQSVMTDGGGVFSFSNLEAGTYMVSKRQPFATIDGRDSTSVPGAVSSENRISNLVLADDQSFSGVDFAEQSLRPELVGIAWFFASAPSTPQMMRKTVALGEEASGNGELAATIRAGGSELPDVANSAPIASDDRFSVDSGETLTVDAALGVLGNDSDLDGDSLTAMLVSQARNGVATLEEDGSLTYTPDDGFSGADSFTYRAQDGASSSNLATVRLTVGSGPLAVDDRFDVVENEVLNVSAASGVLANDSSPGGAALVANLVDDAANGTVTLNANGSFTYAPQTGFTGSDSFTYQARDANHTSNVGTVSIEVTPFVEVNQPFEPVVPGSIEDAGLLGTRMDTLPGAPPFSLDHVTTSVDFSAFENAPSYGAHHAFIPGVTPRPTGVYQTEQPDEDLVHNLEHGHVWISYNPSLISDDDRFALEKFVRDGGTDTGVIMTPRTKNSAAIVVTSLTRQLTLETFDDSTLRSFVNTNRGHSPEGFIPSGQYTSASETLHDGLPHTLIQEGL